MRNASGTIKRKIDEYVDTNKNMKDIIKTEKKYEIAIETALGGNIQNIVTNDENINNKTTIINSKLS